MERIVQRESAPSARSETGPADGVSSSRAVGALRGLSFAEQERALTPPPEPRAGAVQKKAESAEKTAPEGDKTALDGSGWAAVVREHFAEWDSDGDGVLGADELETHINGGRYDGAALAALHTLRGFAGDVAALAPPSAGDKPGVSLADLDAYAKSYPDFPKDSALGRIDPVYEHTTMKLGAADAGLFGADGSPDWKAVEQSGRGSCTFLSALISKASQDPDAIKDMVKLVASGEKDGTRHWTFEVKLGKRKQTVELTELDLLDAATGGDDGLWVAALEQALGQKFGAGKAYDDGADPERGIARLTGGKVRSFELRKAKPEAVRKAMSAGFAKKAATTCSVYRGEESEGLMGGHTYAVIGFDGARVTIRDPYAGSLLGGNRESKYDKEAPEDRADGILVMAFEVFCERFSNVSIQKL